MACLHDHSCEDHDCSSDWSLYKHIDLPRVSANLSLSLSLSSTRIFFFGNAYYDFESLKTSSYNHFSCEQFDIHGSGFGF